MKRIELTNNKFSLVDDEDLLIINNFKWKSREDRNTFYALIHINRKPVLMHQFIINPPSGFIVDHKDGDGLNNQRANLRVCTYSQNSMNQRIKKNNTSGFKGVHLFKGYIRSMIWVNGRNVLLGSNFRSKEEAAVAYDKAAKKYFGEFAYTNKRLGLLN